MSGARRSPYAEQKSVTPRRSASTRSRYLSTARAMPSRRLDAGLQVQQLGRLQHRHGEQPVPARGLGVGERLQERDAALLGELRQHESGQQPDGGAEPPHEVGDLLGRADPDEEQRQRRRPAAPARSANCRTRFSSAAATSRVVDRVLQAQHHGDDAAAGLLDDVVGERGPGGRAVEGGAEGGGEQRGPGSPR